MEWVIANQETNKLMNVWDELKLSRLKNVKIELFLKYVKVKGGGGK